MEIMDGNRNDFGRNYEVKYPDSRLRLAKPTAQDKEQILKYKEEFCRNNEILHGSGGLQNAGTFEAWLQRTESMAIGKDIPENRVPETTYLAFDDKGHLAGMVNIRHYLNASLLRVSGHIGYSVRKSERRKGYGAEMLRLALAEAGKLGIQKVLITCDKENIGSAKTIQKNGGVLENEISDNGRIMQRYWITL